MRELVKSCDGCALAPHFILFDMRRKTQLKVHEHRIICPYCRTGLIFNSLMETIFVARRNCTEMQQGFSHWEQHSQACRAGQKAFFRKLLGGVSSS